MKQDICDICRREIRDRDDSLYLSDIWGASWDLCSVECAASGVARIAVQRGMDREHAAVKMKVDNAPSRIRKWWFK